MSRHEPIQLRLESPPCSRCPAADCVARADLSCACPAYFRGERLLSILSLEDELAADLFDYLDDFALPRGLVHPPAPRLPAFVPQAHADWISRRYPLAAAGIPLARFASEKSNSFLGGLNVARELRASGSRQTLLVATQIDPFLDELWLHRHAFVDAVSRSDVDVVLGPAFSIYAEDSPLEHLLNRSRNLWFYQRLAERGISAVPGIGFTSSAEATQIARWMADEGMTSAFLDLQLSHGLSVDETEGPLRAFLREATSLATVVINGVAAPERIVSFSALFDELSSARLVFTDIEPYQMAFRGVEFFPNRNGKLVKLRSEGAPKDTIYQRLVQYYRQVCTTGELTYVPVGRPTASARRATRSQPKLDLGDGF